MTTQIATRRGRPPIVGRTAILEAARTMPIDDVTMSSLARALGVTPAALYHYFPDRSAVFEALASQLLDDIGLPSSDLAWDEWLRAYAHGMRAKVGSSPWAPHLVGRTAPMEAGLRHVEAALGVLCGDGFDSTEALWAVQLVQRFAVMTGLMEATKSFLDGAAADQGFSAQLDAVLEGVTLRLGPPRPRQVR